MSFYITPPQRAVQINPSRWNANPQGPKAPNAPEGKPPHGDVTNSMFSNAIQILTKAMANQVCQQRVDCQHVTNM